MKILIYTHAFAPMVGGVETYVMLLAEGLVEQNGGSNVQVTVATPTPAGEWNDAALSFRVVRQPGLVNLISEIRRADLIHLAGPSLIPMLLGMFFRKPVVIEHHGYQPVCPNGLLLCEPSKSVCPGHFVARRYHKCLRCNATNLGWVKGLSGLLLTFPRRWLCSRVSQNLPITEHVEHRIGLPRSSVIYYGIRDQTVAAPSLGRNPNAPSAQVPLTFAYVGRFVAEKGLHLLVEAAQRLREGGSNFRVKFVGDGPERSSLQAQVDALGLGQYVTFTGYLRGEALESAVSDVVAVVMPSIWEETAGLAAIEQMMRGRLVIVADIGGLGEVVNGAGLKFPPGDVDSLVSCMKRVLDEPAQASIFGEKGRSRALKHFLNHRMITDHTRLYHQLVFQPTGHSAHARDGER